MSSSVYTIRAKSEDIAEYHRSMACLSALMQQWESINRQHSAADPQATEQIRQRYLKMKGYSAYIYGYRAEQFASLIQQIPGMIAFVRQENEQTQEALIEQQTEQRQLQRARQENVRPQSLLAAGQHPVPLTKAQQALAQRLKDPEPETVPPQYEGYHLHQRLRRIDRHIAELTVLDPQWDISAFTQRATELEQLTQNANWDLLCDSLTLDLAEATRASRTLMEKRQQLSLLAAGLSSYHSAEVNALLERINLVLTSRELPLLLEAITAAQAATEQQQLAIAALARREAILDGLAKLGYEVRESDAETWLNNGKVVIGKPATPGYGLELAGAQGSERFQARAVAFSEQRNTQRDSDIESIWCGEHQQLQQLLAETGNSLIMERALAAGTSPLKVAQPANTSVDQAEDRYRGENSRTLD